MPFQLCIFFLNILQKQARNSDGMGLIMYLITEMNYVINTYREEEYETEVKSATSTAYLIQVQIIGLRLGYLWAIATE